MLEAEARERRARVPTADHGHAAGARDRLGHGSRPLREGFQLKGAHRAVPEHRAGALDLGRVACRARRPDVEADPPVGHVHPVEHPALGVGGHAVAEHEVAGQLQSRALRRGRVREPAPGQLDVVLLAQRGSDGVTLGGEERKAHRPAHAQHVCERQQAIDHADLVCDLGAADDRHQRARRVLEDARQRRYLGRRHTAAGAPPPRCSRVRGARRRRRHSRMRRRAPPARARTPGRCSSRPARSARSPAAAARPRAAPPSSP